MNNEEAIKFIEPLTEFEGNEDYIRKAPMVSNIETVEALKMAIKALQNERPHGEWIEKYSDYGVYYQCSICHKMPPNYECDYKEGAIKTNVCPECGADMRGKENETDN